MSLCYYNPDCVSNQLLRHSWKTPSTLLLWRLHTLVNILLVLYIARIHSCMRTCATYQSTVGGIKTVMFPFRSVETERELCRLPFYHLHTTVACLFRFRSIPFGPGRLRSVVHHAHARRSSCKKNLVESEIAFASVIKMPLFEYLPSCLSLETAPCS